MTEAEKMRAGLWYDANFNDDLLARRIHAKDLCTRFNNTLREDMAERRALFAQIVAEMPEHIEVLSPFMCDYGYNVHLGDGVFINHYSYLMDCAPVTIGAHTFVGPFCGIYTASHPLNVHDRNKGLEKAEPVSIGDNCWIGANVTILPGVTIGNNCVIGAGSLVTKSFEDNSLIMGSPARCVRAIDQDERIHTQD